jgi:hypothetical protein
MPTDHPLYVHRYMERDVAMRDSKTFRIRIASVFDAKAKYLHDAVAERMEVEAGVRVPPGYRDGHRWTQFFDDAPISHLLTALTLTHQLIGLGNRYGLKQASFRDDVRSVLSEENLGYLMDDDGSFRVAIDEDFAGQRVATLAGLGDPLLATARGHYEAAHAAMNEPRDTRAAVREMFEAIEVVARCIAPNATGLNQHVARGKLLEVTRTVMPGDQVQEMTWGHMFDSFTEWVKALQHYRHGSQTGRLPSDDFAIMALSTGGGYLRLLCEVMRLQRMAAEGLEATAHP